MSLQNLTTEASILERAWKELNRIRKSFGGTPTIPEDGNPSPTPTSPLHWHFKILRELSGIRAATNEGRVAGNPRMTPAVVTAGTTAVPSEIVIRPLVGSQQIKTGPKYIRVRLCNGGSFADSSAGTIAPTKGSATVQTITPNKDIVISDVQAVAATRQFLTAGNNNDLDITAKVAGAEGNEISYLQVAPTGPSLPLGISVTNKAITVNLATNAGTKQAIARTVSANAAADATGVSFTVTSAALSSPAIVTINVTNGELATSIGGKIRTALGANTAIAAAFDVAGTGANYRLIRKISAANDNTLAITNGAGVTTAADAGNTVAGVAPAVTSTAAQVKAAIEAHTSANALVSVAHSAGSDGSGVVGAVAVANLAGGLDAEPGVFRVAATHGTANTSMTLRTGFAPVGGESADHEPSLTFSHASAA